MINSTTSSSGPQYFAVTSYTDHGAGVFSVNLFSGVLQYQYEAMRRELAKQNSNVERFAVPSLQITKSQAYRLTQYVEALEPFAYLHDGWNGPGSVAPTPEGFWKAVADSYRLIVFGLPQPNPKLLSDGTLGVSWRNGSAYATIDFEEDGVHLWTITDGKKFKTGTWDAEAKVPTEFRSVGLLSEGKAPGEQVQTDID